MMPIVEAIRLHGVDRIEIRTDTLRHDDARWHRTKVVYISDDGSETTVEALGKNHAGPIPVWEKRGEYNG